MNNGEESRFIKQIEVEGIHSVDKNLLISKTPVNQNMEPFYKKTKLVEEKLNAIIKNGVSASMLCLYAMDQIKFFETYVLGLKEEIIEETIASSTIGNIVHDSLELIYKEYVGKKLKIGDLKKMKEKINPIVQNTIKNYEPRVKLLTTSVSANADSYEFDVIITYEIVGIEAQAQQLSFALQPTR